MDILTWTEEPADAPQLAIEHVEFRGIEASAKDAERLGAMGVYLAWAIGRALPSQRGKRNDLDPTCGTRATSAERHRRKRYRKIARLTEEQLREFVQQSLEKGCEPSQAAALQLATKLEKQQKDADANEAAAARAREAANAEPAEVAAPEPPDDEGDEITVEDGEVTQVSQAWAGAAKKDVQAFYAQVRGLEYSLLDWVPTSADPRVVDMVECCLGNLQYSISHAADLLEKWELL